MSDPDKKTQPDNEKQMVILDVDGVLNSYSNFKFYRHFAVKSLKHLAKVHGRRKLLFQLPKLKKMGGANALFAFAKQFCGDEQKFKQFRSNLLNSLNFDLIAHDPSMKGLIERLSRYGKICVRSDGLTDIAAAAWQRVIEGKPSAAIKLDMLKSKRGGTSTTCRFNGRKIIISGIEDNNFKPKNDSESWKDFAKKHHVNLQKSVLLDDSRENTRTAEYLGMLTVHVSKIDSLLQKSSLGTVYGYSLTDILGRRLTTTLGKFKISCGRKVNPRELFHALLGKTADKENRSKTAVTSRLQKNASYC